MPANPTSILMKGLVNLMEKRIALSVKFSFAGSLCAMSASSVQSSCTMKLTDSSFVANTGSLLRTCSVFFATFLKHWLGVYLSLRIPTQRFRLQLFGMTKRVLLQARLLHAGGDELRAFLCFPQRLLGFVLVPDCQEPFQWVL